MTRTYNHGLSFVFMILTKGCYTIPLPGVRSHLIYQNSDLTYNPSQEYVFQNKMDFKPSFRSVVPQVNNNIPSKPDQVSWDKPTFTESPIENLLDKLYGNNKWRNLLDKNERNPIIPPTGIPILAETTPISSFHGFYSYEISGTKFNGLPKSRETTTISSSVTSQYPKTSGNSKFMMKIIGTRQHVVPDALNLDSKKPEAKDTEWGTLSKDTGVSSMLYKGQGVINQKHLTMKPPIMSVTQKPQMAADGSSDIDQNRVYIFGGDQPQYSVSSSVNNFNPNEINNKQNIFRPNSAFNSFITQTGSDPSNRQLPVAYDADAINDRYIEHIDSLFQGQSRHAIETIFGTQQYGYRFSAYGDAKPQPYDADALNSKMMENNQNMAHNPMSSIFPSSRKGLQTTSSTKNQLAKMTNYTELIAIHKNENTAKSESNVKLSQISTTNSPLIFNFVPGNLFPGQSQTFSEHQQNAVQQKGLSPQFLRHIPVGNRNDAFNPDKINAAQNAFDPNAISWLQSRNTGILGKREIEDEVNISSTIPRYTVMTTQQPKHVNTTLSSDIQSLDNASYSEKEKSSAVANSGFDPNFLNSNQGQTNFIPGQIAPSFAGYIQNQYGTLQSIENLQTNGMGEKDEAKMTFDVASLLGIERPKAGNNTSSSKGTMPLFNANSANNLMKVDGGSKNPSNMSGFGTGYMGIGFDPNAANQGFSNVLGSNGNNSVNGSVPYAYGIGRFNPNAANLGFSTEGFGKGNGDAAGGNSGNRYMSAFDPNKVNQMTVQSPFGQSTNGSTNSNTSYFLGIVTGVTGQSSKYSSAYISAFNPDSVNVAPYDPNKYNQVHLHFDPLDMLSKNPGIDNDTLVAAASAFDPNRINYPNMQQALSPVAMLSQNNGINLKFDPYTSVSLNRNTTTVSKGATQFSWNSSANTKQVQTGFDPVALMSRLMSSGSAFKPGNVGIGELNHDPSATIGSNGIAHAQSTTATKLTPPANTSVAGSTRVYGSARSSASSSIPSTISTESTNSPKNGAIE